MVTGLVAAFLIGAAPAHAECDWPLRAAKASRPAPGKLPPLAIGDSTMLFAVKYLARRGFDANARVCRSWNEGLDIVAQRKRAGRLPSFVVIGLGANSTLRPVDIERGVRLLGPGRTLGLMTHRTWLGKPGPDTAVIRRAARRWRGRVVLMDWVRFAQPHPGWFVADGLHTNELGSRNFADFIAGFRRYAK